MIAAAALLPRELLVRITARTSASRTDATDTAGSGEALRLMEGIPEPVLLLTASGTILAFNSKAADDFPALSPDRHISSIIRSPQVLAAVDQIARGEGRRTVSYIERVPVERRMAATVSAVKPGPRGPRTDAPAIMIFLRDLTGQDRLNEMRTDFVANASHELKTPLASLTGFIETLQGPAKNDAQARERFLAIMLKQTQRMSRLVDNLLSLSRVEMHAHLRPGGAVDLSEIARHAVQALEPQAAASGVTVEFAEPDGEALVPGDRDELSQVLQNLIHNGIKYGHEGGHVRVGIERIPAERKLMLTVADDGTGIAAQHLPRLTERFYRAASGESGAGLGLAIVQHAVKRHQGELRIESELGKGSTFSVILPEARED
jgi:two-component system phosphate regulon sensor histidine kinase PhoR